MITMEAVKAHMQIVKEDQVGTQENQETSTKEIIVITVDSPMMNGFTKSSMRWS